VSRFNMGLVIAAGLTIGTLFTLFVVPAVYLAIGADHSRKEAPERTEAALPSPAPVAATG
jgi:multidrug efflux pump